MGKTLAWSAGGTEDRSGQDRQDRQGSVWKLSILSEKECQLALSSPGALTLGSLREKGVRKLRVPKESIFGGSESGNW